MKINPAVRGVCAVLLVLALCGCDRIAKWRGSKTEELSGTLEVTRVDIRAEVGGRVLALAVEEGMKVNVDQVLCELDTEKLDLQARAARAQLTAQKAMLEAMQKGARAREIEQVRLLASQAREQKDKAERDFEKFSRLHGKHAISDQEFQDAQTMLKLARDRAGQAQAQYQLVLEGVRDEDLRAQAAAVDAAEAQLSLAQIQLEDARIKSPINGTLSERYVEVGELVVPGALVATVADYTSLELKVYVEEDKLGQVSLGQAAHVSIDSFPGRAFSGRVKRISEEAEFTPKNIQTKKERTTLVFEVTITVANPDLALKAGLPADAVFK